MTWQVGIEVDLKTKQTIAYTVENQSQSLPVNIVFHDKNEAKKFADWLNVKDDWIDKLEMFVEDERDVESIREGFKSSRGLSEFDTVI